MTRPPVRTPARRYPLPFASLPLALAGLCGVLMAQTPQPVQPQRPTFRTEANLVRVDVFATAGERVVLDLGREEFQVFEDGAKQAIESFEHVVVRRAGPQTARVEPNTQREGYAMAADPHNRVFVAFLDTNHVGIEGSHNIQGPLVRLIDRILGPDDLIGVMTPEMSASQLILARKTEVIERGLRENWSWGRRNRLNALDAVEQTYTICYPPQLGEGGTFSAVAREMIARRREKMTLDAVLDLVRHLNSLREERKAIIAVSEGWTLFGPHSSLLARALPVPPQVFVSPRGVLTTKDERNVGGATRSECDRDRLLLADLDDQQYFRDIVREADRSNASFYPVDPRGLVAFDTQLGGLEPPLMPAADHAQLRAREESLRTLAAATDGIAVLSSNNIDRGFRQVADDLSSYYLLGYYSTNTKLDGNYRRIEVRVTRPGVSVRARRGYRAASAEEIARGAAAPLPAPGRTGELDAALSRELATLASARPNDPLHLRGVLVPGANVPTLWVAGELSDAFARTSGRQALGKQGAEVRVMASADRGDTLGTARVKLEGGARSFLTRLTLDRALGAGGVQVQAQVGGAGGDGERVDAVLTVPVTDAGPDGLILPPLLFRRGPSTAGAFQPAAYPQFRRTETLRAEAPLSADASGASGRLLDRQGNPMAVPVRVTERRDEATGQRWLVADVTLAPLTTAEFVLALGGERDGARHDVLIAFKVVR